MHLLEGVLIALEALWANKLRTILTLLGNIVGVMSVIAVVSIIDGANSYIENEVAGEGSGVFSVQQVNRLDILSDFDKFLESLHNPEITLSDLAFLRERVTLAEYMDAALGANAEVRNRALYVSSVAIQGRSENYPMLGRWELKDGRHFSIQEVQHNSDVAVIGFDIADRLYPALDPIGKEIRIAGMPFRIIGVLKEKPSGLGSNPNLTAIVPVTSLQRIFGRRRPLTINIKPKDLDQVAACVDQTRLAMRILRRLGPKREDNFAIITQDNLLDLWKTISSQIFTVLIGIVSISLVVGGIVIMNIMLVSVTERTREIGIRKAVGATSLNILWQFLVEAVTLSSVGGVLGIAAGFVIAAAIAYFSPLPYAIEVWSIAIGMGVTFAVGVFFGAYPAMQAAKLDPIEALRYE
jgi:putative ABC transport system permease protein